MEKNLSLWLNPFNKIAGWQALTWGTGGIIISTFLSYFSGYHYHGLLHFGPAPNNTLLCYATEHLLVWIIPSILFLTGGLILSKSRIRIIDIFGTVAFAQLPFILMNLFYFLPPMQQVHKTNMNLPPMELISQPGFYFFMILSLISIIFPIWVLVWMFNAFKTSSNLKGAGLYICYFTGIILGDVICRIIISQLYKI